MCLHCCRCRWRLIAKSIISRHPFGTGRCADRRKLRWFMPFEYAENLLVLDLTFPQICQSGGRRKRTELMATSRSDPHFLSAIDVESHATIGYHLGQFRGRRAQPRTTPQTAVG